MRKKSVVIPIISVLLLCVVIFLSGRFDDFDLDRAQTEEIKLTVNNHVIAGTLVLPKSQPQAIAIFIHGDGSQDRFSDSGYLPLINELIANNIAVFSWDKAGVGESTGNWLHQSMTDRADEAEAVLQLLRQKYPSPSVAIGYFGFSQAGWVIPIAASHSSPDFSVIVGGAVNWREQGAYYHRMRLVQEGVTDIDVDKQVQAQLQLNDQVLGENGSRDPKTWPEMSADRFQFVANNYLNDAAMDIPKMNGRILAIWGADDLNVDAQTDSCRYKYLLEKKANSTVVLVDNGTHGLLNANIFNYQLESQWPWWKKAYFLYLGRDAYKSDVLSFITNWVKRTSVSVPPSWQIECEQ